MRNKHLFDTKDIAILSSQIRTETQIVFRLQGESKEFFMKKRKE